MTNKLPRYLLVAIYAFVTVAYMGACSQRMQMNQMIDEQNEQLDFMMQQQQQQTQQMMQGF